MCLVEWFSNYVGFVLSAWFFWRTNLFIVVYGGGDICRLFFIDFFPRIPILKLFSIFFFFFFFGPKPDAPRNLTLEKMAQGWVLSWLAPLNRTVAVAYYRVEFRQIDQNWQYTDPIPYDTAFLCKLTFFSFLLHLFPFSSF